MIARCAQRGDLNIVVWQSGIERRFEVRAISFTWHHEPKAATRARIAPLGERIPSRGTATA
jgi:hypothetical protein